MMKSSTFGRFEDEDDGLFKNSFRPSEERPICDATESDDASSDCGNPTAAASSASSRRQQRGSLSPSPTPPKILWSCVARDDTILAEANDVGRHDRQDVADAARQLLRQRCTPGFEYHTQNKLMGRLLGRLSSPKKIKNGSGAEPDQSSSSPSFVPLKGIKFHVFEHIADDCKRTGGEDEATDHDNIMVTTTDAVAGQKESTPHLRVWVFAAIYDPGCTNRRDVQSFLEKLVHITDQPRSYDPEWHIAKTLGLQSSFAPTLQQRMMEVTYLGKVALLQQQVYACQEQMEHNIDLMLENVNKAEDLDEEATYLKGMCHVFKKKAKDVKRHHMRANAKYGLVAGTAATGLAAAIIVPLVAL